MNSFIDCWLIRLRLFILPLLFSMSACTEEHNLDDEDGKDAGTCEPETNEGCEEPTVCELTTYGENACFVPLMIRGRVTDLATTEAIEGALVVARDANGAAVSDVAVTGPDGDYALRVPIRRTDEEGAYEGEAFTLRVGATGYASYPDGFRPSLPVDPDGATKADEEITLKTPTTDVALIPLPGGAAGLGSISGLAPRGAGALIVAKSASGVRTGVADLSGRFTVLNVPAGNVTLEAYTGALEYSPLTVTLPAGEDLDDQNFSEPTDVDTVVAGQVNIVNAPGGAVTSVVLVVEETFNNSFERGEVPPGLRAAEITGAFEVRGVPKGKYVVLAAFENDDLVRDPDTELGGTDIVHIEVTGEDITLSAFKVTEALELRSPGAEAPEPVSGAPTLIFADDSSEESYTVVVYDSFGNLVWQDNSIGKVTGNEWVNVEYAGPPLERGLYYQWRATSFNKKGVPLSTTEDLRGLFFLSE